ncbi:DUF677 domain-containing protein [Psychrobacter sp. TAE2020]|uniref:DUF677 domain-containing protein n=1 Tax=Psychrobacter sp. TAE2020 TaxID=2846762 RepID=UPI001C0FCB8A|nr:DUF677 domain-containing protein [Psychrobacter sp. TAE2020]MBU5617991.1 DUF677 domain-containing protein [Psychrobacter sp. TAE2020]
MYLVGFFKELGRDFNDFPDSIYDFKNKLDPDIKPIVLNYLTQSTGIFDWLETVRDCLNREKIIPGGGSCIWSDGEWIFREDLAYYIKEYDVGLPSKFIEKIINSNGIPPLSDETVRMDLDEIMSTINRAYDGDRDMFIEP